MPPKRYIDSELIKYLTFESFTISQLCEKYQQDFGERLPQSTCRDALHRLVKAGRLYTTKTVTGDNPNRRGRKEILYNYNNQKADYLIKS